MYLTRINALGGACIAFSQIEAFNTYKDPPPKCEWKPKKRPKAGEWKKLEKSPEYKNNNSLREYQLEGLNWLNFSYYNSYVFSVYIPSPIW